MLYLIDGNNVMGRKRTRQELLSLLASFVYHKKAKVHVIFDGAPDPHHPEGSAYHGVKISYSQRGKDADSKIRNFVEKTSNPRQLTVVTSDRSLASYSKIHSVKHLGSAEFLALIAEIKQKEKLQKQDNKPQVKGELKEWLRYFGFEPHEADQD